MARFLSAQWVAEFNEALRGVDLTDAQGTASVVASERPFTVVQEVSGTPEGPVRTVLRVDGGAVTMALGQPEGDRTEEVPDVTILLEYEDAVALSRGELDPAGALANGRVRVRGDLSVLVAGQAVLAAAAGHLAGLTASTTY